MILSKNNFSQELKLNTTASKLIEEIFMISQLISIKQYDKVSKISAGQGDDYTAGCLLDFAYFEKNAD